MTAKLKTTSISSFALGMNTRRPDFKLKSTEAPYGTYVREIVNADISDTGALKLRRGYTKVLSATVGGSLWSDDAQGYYASGSSLMSLTDTGTLTQTAVTGATLVSGAPVSFFSAPVGGAYWTDGTSLGFVKAGVSIPLVPPQPVTLPVITSGAGSLDAGIYSVAFVSVDADGRESAPSPTVAYTLTSSSSLIFTLAATPAFRLKAYVSLPNGILMYAALSFVSSGTQTLLNLLSVGEACMTVGLMNMPAGRFVRYNNGRLLVVVGSTLYYSKPFMPGLYDPTSDFIPLPATITVCEIVSNEGLFVVADQTYWLAGDIAETTLTPKLQFGAVMGSGFNRPDNKGCFWMSNRGICTGDEGGATTLLQDDNVSVSLTLSGASLMADRDGAIQLITSLYGGAQTPDSEGSKYTSTEFTDVAGTGETWVVQDETKASWRYMNYAFTSFAQIAARYYGVRADGVYLLEGTTDAGAKINFSMSPGRQNFGSSMLKRMEAAYMTVSSAGMMKLTITDDKGVANTYSTRRNAATLQQQRLDIGRGISGNYLNFQIMNDAGCTFELSGYELVAVETTRRIA